MMADRAARSTTAASTARAMVAATHALHVHTIAVVLSHCRWTCGSVGRPLQASPGASLGQPRSIGVDDGTRRETNLASAPQAAVKQPPCPPLTVPPSRHSAKQFFIGLASLGR